MLSSSTNMEDSQQNLFSFDTENTNTSAPTQSNNNSSNSNGSADGFSFLGASTPSAGAIDDDFFSKLVDDLFLDNEYFAFPSNSNNNNNTASTPITSPAPNTTAGLTLSPLNEPEESLIQPSPVAYPAPAPLALPSFVNSNAVMVPTKKRVRDFTDNIYSFDNIASKVSSITESSSSTKKQKKQESDHVDFTTKEKNYVGVTYHAPSNRYRARIKIDNKTTHLGYFDTDIEAAIAYDRAAWELRGAKAHLNFSATVASVCKFDPNANISVRDRCVLAAKTATGMTELPTF